MIINNHILSISNIYYFNKMFYINNINNNNINKFIDNYKQQDISFCINLEKCVTIENMLVINTIHSCYAHALIDYIFPYFWAINDIKKYNNTFKNFTVFIREKQILEYSKQNMPLIDNKLLEYKGVWGELINLLSEKLIFEHSLKNHNILFIKNCYFYIKNDNWQRSPWNNINYYPGRNINISDVIYNDTIIYNNLKLFIKYVKNKYNIYSENIEINRAIIIERKYDRFWNKLILEQIIKNLKKNSNIIFSGIKILEDMTLYEQIKLFSNHNIFIFRHGSSFTNLLWIPQNSIIFDIDIRDNRKEIVKRLAKITNSRVISMSYYNINYNNLISLVS